MAPNNKFRLPLFHVALTFGSLTALVGIGLGALIGVAFNHVEAGASIGFIVGAVSGLLASLDLARRLDRDFATPPSPPRGGWRRWHDDDSWDN